MGAKTLIRRFEKSIYFGSLALGLGKKAFTVGVVVTTIAWSIGLAMFLVPLAANAAAPVAGDLIKASLPSVYYYGANGKRYVFPNEKTYKTWYSDFSSVKTITDSELAAISLGGNVTYKPGVKMVKITTDPKVYAVAANGTLRWVKTEAIASSLYGSAWNTLIDDVPDAFFTNYTVGTEIAAAGDYNKAAVTAAATDIGTDKGIGAAVTPVVSGALTVALASDTPAAATIVCDTDASEGSQIKIPVVKYTFTASSAGAVKVTSLKLKRGGIAADADLNLVTLWDGDTKLGEHQSISKTYITFANTSGLFEVVAGSSKTVTVKIDLTNGDVSSCAAKTYNLGIEASTDVTSNAASIGGTFPATGNTMTGAGVTDLGKIGISSYTTYPSTIDPGDVKQELWRLALVATNQDMELRYLKLDVIGTVSASDLANIYLDVNGVQIGTTQQLASDKTVTFDLRSSPLILTAGQTKNLLVKGDVVGGSTRSFKFTVQSRDNIEIRDRNYNVLTKVDLGNGGVEDSFSVVQPTTSTGTTINAGRLVMSIATDSPTGNIADYATGLTLAKFGIQAIGEDIRIVELNYGCVDGSGTAADLLNVKLLLEGVQVGTTDSVLNCDAAASTGTAITFGNTFIVPSGTTKYLSFVADTTATGSGDTAGYSVDVDDTLSIYLAAGSSGDAVGRVSLENLTPTAQNGRTLTVKAGTVTVTKNSSFSDRSATQPSGVVNETNVKIGSFIINAGSGEAVDVTAIILYDGSEVMGTTWQNLKIKHNGTQIGTTLGALHSTAATYTFTPSPAIRIEAGAQYAVDVYADIKSGAGGGTVANVIEVDEITATGVSTSSDASVNYTNGSGLVLQAGYVAARGNMFVTADPDTPIAQQLVRGSTEQVIAKFKVSASSTEAINITQIVLSASSTDALMATGTFKNIKLYDGTTQIGSAIPGFVDTYSSSTSKLTYVSAVFSGLTLDIAKGGNKILTAKADITSYDDGGTTAQNWAFGLMSDYDDSDYVNTTSECAFTATGKSSGTSLVNLTGQWYYGATWTATHGTVTAAMGNVMTIYRTKLSVAWASDTPSGVSSPNSAQTIAKFVISNSANVGDYTATVNLINFSMSQSGASCLAAGTDRYLYVYKDSILTANLLASTFFCQTGYIAGEAFGHTATTIANGSFTDVDIAAGTSKTFWVTGDTTDNNSGSVTETLSISVAATGMTWTDGISSGITAVDTLPLLSKTFTY